MWWASLGQNVGSDGKGDRFSRPVLIMRKLAHGFYPVAPTTTKSREGTWYVHVRLSNLDEYVCLNQIRTIDYRRLSSKAGQIETLFRCVGGSEDVPHAASSVHGFVPLCFPGSTSSRVSGENLFARVNELCDNGLELLKNKTVILEAAP